MGEPVLSLEGASDPIPLQSDSGGIAVKCIAYDTLKIIKLFMLV